MLSYKGIIRFLLLPSLLLSACLQQVNGQVSGGASPQVTAPVHGGGGGGTGGGGGCSVVSITGTYNITPGVAYVYTATASQTAISWNVQNGQFQSTTATTATVVWGAGASGGTGTLRAYVNGCVAGTYTVTIPPILPLVSGVVTPDTQTIYIYNRPAPLSVSTASGGTGGYTYYWQYSTDSINFASVIGAKSQTYAPGILLQKTWYRVATDDNSGNEVFSSPITVNVILPPSGANPSRNQNFIETWTATAPETNPDNMINRVLSDAKLNVQYFDGLGRPMQTVAQQGSLETSSGNLADIVSPIVYDPYGREATQYLPYSGGGSDGTYKILYTIQQPAFYSAASPSNPINGQGDTVFTGQTIFEGSPLNRPLKVMEPGNNWAGSNRGAQTGYWNNQAADSVQIWNITESGSAGSFATVASSGIYSAASLHKLIHTDEQGKQVIEFTDLDGNLILKKVQINPAVNDNGTGTGYSGWACTYYIYDDLRELRLVIQPVGVATLAASGWALTTTLYAEQCFRYEYDGLRRMIQKQVPGGGTMSMVYDLRDRPIMIQDANLSSAGLWHVTLYEDSLNRPIQTGLYSYATTSFSTLLNTATSTIDYPFTSATTPAWPVWERLSVTHYDDYTGLPAGLSSTLITTGINMSNFYIPSSSAVPYAQAMTPVSPITTVTTKGLVTWAQLEVLGSQQTLNISYVKIYDDKTRAIQQQTLNYSGGLDISTTQYDFTGHPIVTDLRHQKLTPGRPAQVYEVVARTSCDALNRPVKVEKMLIAPQIPTPAWKTVTTLSYDVLGHVKVKTLGNNPVNTSSAYQPLETLINDYNIRGWLLGINRSYINNTSAQNFFGMELGYDKTSTIVPATSYANPQYNGNISGMVWENAGDGAVRKYDFTYDAANRLTSADFNQYNTSFNKNDGLNFSVSNLNYDLNGNILSMGQMGWKSGSSVPVDQLKYSYYPGTNRLQNVIDSASDPTTTLGDFRYSQAYTTALGGSKTVAALDYGYDGNGNLTSDKNKDITSIRYNFLNLPDTILVNGKGQISYIYDASGNKLAKITQENNAQVSSVTTNITTTTVYDAGFVYETKQYSAAALASTQYTDRLQFIGQEDGRIRALDTLAAYPDSLAGFAWDYFIRDHLGNTRLVLTEEQETDAYPTLTFEGANTTAVANQNAVWDNAAGQSINVLSTRVAIPATGFTQAADSAWCGMITKGQGAIGAAKLIRVMARDQLNVSVNYTYTTAAVNNSSANGLGTLATSLAAMILGSPEVGAAMKGQAASIASGVQSSSSVAGFFSPETASSTTTGVPPEAYLHVLLFNDQFVFDKNNSQVLPVSTSGLNSLAQLTAIVPIPKSGYAYIYFSNESNTPVYFDNLAMTHVRGPILETNTYYPFGLSMAAISDKALMANYFENKYRYNNKELQSKEFSDGTGLEEYDFGARMLDPQLGRWHVLDPLSEISRRWSPYNYVRTAHLGL